MGCGDIDAFSQSPARTGMPSLSKDARRTPNLDALASQGICLTQHYSGSPVCAPSRAALMTGRYPHRTGAIDTLEGRGLDRLALDEITMADVLKQAGYVTGLIGKWHLGALDPRYHPNARGFDEFVGFRGGWSDYYLWRLDSNGSLRKSTGRYLTDVFTEEAIGFIRRHSEEPWFLHVAYNAPHFPLQAPEEEIQPFRETGRFNEGVCRIYAMNHRMDTGIGTLLDELDHLGIADNTLVLFTSDNGPQLGGQGENCTTRFNCDLNGCKGLTYEGGIRVPAILSWPAGLEPGRTVGEFVHFTDWLPTLADLADAELPDRPLDGRSVLPALRSEAALDQPRRFWQWNRYSPLGTCNAAMREGSWKLVRPVIAEAMWLAQEDLDMDRRLKYEPEGITDVSRDPEPARTIPDPPPPLLFNLDDDPFERSDLAPRRPDIVGKMQSALDAWFADVEADRARA